MRRSNKRLVIRTETIRRLEQQQLHHVVGGVTVIGCAATQHPHTACDPIETAAVCLTLTH